MYAELRRRAAPWGDQIADDDWQSLVSVRSWDECASDEYIRVFPNLLELERADRLTGHIEQALAVLIWHCYQSVGLGGVACSLSPPTIEAIARKHWLTWFPRAWTIGWRRREVVGCDEDRRAVVQLDAILRSLRTNRPLAYDERLAAALAFWAGVHPIYIWPEAFCRHAMYSALGWFGFCARGRGAILPVDVAEWLADAIEVNDAGKPFVPDRTFAYYLRTTQAAAFLRAAARRRLAGRETIIRRPALGRAGSEVVDVL